MSKGTNIRIALDIGTYSIKLVEVSFQDNGLQVEKVISLPIPSDLDRKKPESMGKWLGEVWRYNNIKSRVVRLVLPRNQVLLTEVELPAGDDVETKQMLELQLERILPVPVDSVISDYYVMSTSELGDRKIVVVSVKTEVINYYTVLIHQAGLIMESMDLSSLCFSRCVESSISSTESWTAINIGHSNTEVIVVEKGYLTFTRSTPIGLSQTDWMNKLFFDLKRSFEVYSLEFGRSVPLQIVLCGSASQSPEWIDLLKDKLGEGIQVIHINTTLGQQLHIDSIQSEYYVNAYGLIITLDDHLQPCDFLNPRLFTPQKRQYSTRIKQVGIGVLSAVFVVLILGGILYMKQKKLDQLQADYSKYRPLVAKSEQVSASTALIRSWKKEQISIISILRELSINWSEEAYLQVLSYDRTKDISMTGLASNNQAVAELLEKLNKSPNYTDTKFTYIRSSKRNPTYPVEFGLTMKYKNNVNATVSTITTREQ